MAHLATSVLLLMAATGLAEGHGHSMLAILRKSYSGNSNCTDEKGTLFVGFSGACIPHPADAGVPYSGKWRTVTCLSADASTADEVTYADAACTIPASSSPDRVLGMEGACSWRVAGDSMSFCKMIDTFSLYVYPNDDCSGNETTTEKVAMGECFATDSAYEKTEAVPHTLDTYKQTYYSDRRCTHRTDVGGLFEVTFAPTICLRRSDGTSVKTAPPEPIIEGPDLAVRPSRFFATLLLAVAVKLSL
mmetsp:Transcript_12434/g.29285  ORF Transcript_12434/g.29285 Transcript_12434/m.29285 type:complete len:247 (+) Transcript_12434:88-828(+)